MCLIQTNATADAGFEEMGKADKSRFEKKLFKFADADSVVAAGGLALQLHSVDDWSKDDTLKGVRKFRSGRHRFYVTGRHTDCQYLVCFILVSKRDADDKPGTPKFQKVILKALSDKSRRTLEPPPPDDQADDTEAEDQEREEGGRG